MITSNDLLGDLGALQVLHLRLPGQRLPLFRRAIGDEDLRAPGLQAKGGGPGHASRSDNQDPARRPAAVRCSSGTTIPATSVLKP